MVAVAAATTGEPLRGFPSRASFAAALAALSFAVYVCTIFSLPSARDARYCCEQESLAAAVSNVMYGAPLGALYGGVFDYLVARMDKPLAQVLAAAQEPGIGLPSTPPGTLAQTTRDGIGAGYPLVATAAFRVFGLHAWSLTAMMLVLMAASAGMFLARFSGAAFAGAVILYFSALTVLLFTRLVSDPHYAMQFPVAGVRYFSLVGVLPMFDILLTLLDRQPAQPGSGTRNAVLLGLQAAILAVVMLVRGSAFASIGLIALVGLAVAWTARRNRRRLQTLLGELGLIALLLLGVFVAIGTAMPRYVSAGRFGPLVWHRMVISLGVSPQWPFAGINKMFDCRKYVPDGIQGGMPDENGHCIWTDYISKHNIPAERIAAGRYGPLYEAALRKAFFKIAARYPGEVLKAFFYYKPQLIAESIAQSVGIKLGEDVTGGAAGHNLVPFPPLALGLLLASLAVAVAHFGIGARQLPELRPIAIVNVLSAASTIPAYLAAWAMPDTSADLLLYCFLASGLALAAGLVSVRRALRVSISPAVEDFA